jgi:hypothetical protein
MNSTFFIHWLSALLLLLSVFQYSSAFPLKNTPPQLFFQPESTSEYTFSSFSGTYTEITGGTLSTMSGNDGAENITLPFPFIYDSLIYTNARISMNGWLELGQSYSGLGYSNDLSNPDTRPLLAPFWDDLYDDISTQIRYQVLGSSPDQIFVVQWKQVRMSSTVGPRLNFQVRIYETTNTIEFWYGAMETLTNASASIGLTNPPAGISTFLSVTPGSPATVSSTTPNNNITSISYLPSGTTYRFTPPCFHLWNGNTDTNWFNTANWTCDTVPGAIDNATILMNALHDPIINSDVNLNVLGIDADASVSLNGGNLSAAALRIFGSILVAGSETITLSGTQHAWYRDPTTSSFNPGSGAVLFTGSGILTTNTSETFNHLTLQSGKAFDPGSQSLTVNGTFTNEGTYWPSMEATSGSILNSDVVNKGVWRARDSLETIQGNLHNQSGATFNASQNVSFGTVIHGNVINEGTFNASSTGRLRLYGDWSNAGSFTPANGTVEFVGTGIQNLQDTGGGNSFYNLVVGDGSQTIPNNPLEISHDLTVQAGGTLDIGAIDLRVGGLLTNNGALIQTKLVLANNSIEFLSIRTPDGAGQVYWGLTITPEADMGLAIVEIRGSQTNGCTTNPADELVTRCFKITPVNITSATIRFFYSNSELNGQIYNGLKLWHYAPSWMQAGSNYTYSSTCATAQIDCWFQAEQVDDYSWFGLGSGNQPTAIKLDRLNSFESKGYAAIIFIGISIFALMIWIIGYIFHKWRVLYLHKHNPHPSDHRI